MVGAAYESMSFQRQIILFCVHFDVMYSGEYNVCDVTLIVYPHPAS
jgi:hypothetical protein